MENVANKLNDMLFLYLDENFKNAYLQNVKQKDKLFVHEATFKNYFLNGKLNYREQEIAHIRRLFHPYNDLIIKRIGIDLNTLISLCDYSEEIYKKKTLTLSNSDVDFINRIKKIASEENANQLLEKEIENLSDSFLDYMENPHSNFLFTETDFHKKFNPREVSIFCRLFSVSINDNLDFLYYTQKNPLDEKPIVKISTNTYLQIYNKQLPTSLYSILYKTLTQTQKELSKLNHRRGKKVFEEHVLNLFIDFFKKDSNYEVYKNYYVEGGSNEKDILIISKYNAFIIECKVSRLREPLRDLDTAFIRIKKDFKECIQKGYDQCYEVEKKCLDEDILTIEDSNKKIVQIETSNLINVFSIVVTLEMFGPIQTNLEYLLERNSNSDFYPWVVSVDDLETFLKSLKVVKNNPINSFIDYLILRENYNEKVLTGDEMDLCASFLKNRQKFKSAAENNDFVIFDPQLQNYFDDLYFSEKLKFLQ